MTRRKAIGFDRKVELAWLDAVASKVLNGDTPDEVRQYLWGLLDGIIEGKTIDGARRKTITVLGHIWSTIPDEATGLRVRALELYKTMPDDQRLVIHWAMMMATYPFFTDTAAIIGRLLGLQGSIAVTELTRRLVERWGDRSTLPRAAQRIVRSMFEWGVLREVNGNGVYEAAMPRQVDQRIAELLVEAILIDSHQATLPITQVMAHPALFPFRLSLEAYNLRQLPQFDVYRQGLDMDVVGLVNTEIGSKSC